MKKSELMARGYTRDFIYSLMGWECPQKYLFDTIERHREYIELGEICYRDIMDLEGEILRRTGRTTRMVTDAMCEALGGKDVMLVGYGGSGKEYLSSIVGNMLARLLQEGLLIGNPIVYFSTHLETECIQEFKGAVYYDHAIAEIGS